jgi:hypothetical protein
VGLFNRGGDTAKMTVKWSEVGVSEMNPKVRDLWAHQDVTAPAEMTVDVPSHGVVMVTVRYDRPPGLSFAVAPERPGGLSHNTILIVDIRF